ncbi:SMP-30/gluconolactonase/LRE family protein [Thorsellia kenyensis]|uniref:SMP-30/gluconolactonase/LRE family protein n=1 Tax=Thorsellia kenyensis TaxID=1549888 RepID=A0ABV6CD33_9GAMM
MTTFTPLLPHKAQLGECPRYDERTQILYWVDITAPAIHAYNTLDNTHTVYATHEHVGCFALHEQGGFIAGMRSGIWYLDAQAKPIKKLADNPTDNSITRFNDGRADAKGRFWLGTVDEDKSQSVAAFYCFDGKQLTQFKSGLLTSNGVAFSPDNQYLYHSDTPRFTIYRHAFNLEEGTIDEGETFLSMPREIYGTGRPDGAAVDSEGYYWSALFEGNAIIRVSPAGEIVATYPIDVKCPTMCAFGGENLDILYVTSASIGRSQEELLQFPDSGKLFSMKVPVKGCLDYRCTFKL